jgi:hypothetical protein
LASARLQRAAFARSIEAAPPERGSELFGRSWKRCYAFGVNLSSSWFRAWFVVLLGVVAVACGSKKHPPLSEQVGEIDAGDVTSTDPCASPTPDNGSGPLVTQTSTLTGRVLDPAGKNPLYNVSVYIPKDQNLPALSKGVSCDRCGATVINPLVSTLTDETGTFVLHNVSQGIHKVVVQVGKWRKVVSVDVNSACFSMGDVSLPKNGSEGDMPQIAVTTGALDALECLLRNIGIDESEFMAGAGGTGHVHIFNGFGGHGPAGTPDAETALWGDAKAMSAYDMVALSCEGNEHNENKTNMQAMHDFAEAGGRVFGTHYHYTWLKNGPQPDWKNVAAWTSGPSGFSGTAYEVNETFPKGKSFGKWLLNVGASFTEGKIPLGNVTTSIGAVNPATSENWIDLTADSVKYFTFNVPISSPPAKQCGRVVMSDIHVFPNGGEQWPAGCGPVTDLEPQQKALEFLFFDLSACVQSDSDTPVPVH